MQTSSQTGATREGAQIQGNNTSRDKRWDKVSVELLWVLFREDSEAKASAESLIPVNIDVHEHFDLNLLFDGESAISKARITSHRYRADLTRAQIIELPSALGLRAATLVEPLEFAADLAASFCDLSGFKGRGKRSGAGTLIGIIDSGIDPAHPMFAHRVQGVWDQTMPGVSGGFVPFGTWHPANQLGGVVDSVGHGTHVAGIAGGNDSDYPGVADQANFVIVKTTLDDSHVESGLRFLKKFHEDAKQPMVVNLSMQGHRDPHDGSGALCEAIDELSAPGFIVCCAAGNAGQELTHAEIVLLPGSGLSVGVAVNRTPLSRIEIKGWADSDAEISIDIVSPDGTLWQTAAYGDPAAAPVESHQMGGAQIDVVRPKPEPAFNGQVAFLVVFGPRPNESMVGEWQLKLFNEGAAPQRIDIWSPEKSGAVFDTRGGSDRVKIGAPGAAARAITVGALVTRTAWQDQAGNSHHDPDNRRFHAAHFSSPGPLRSGSLKPDLLAPGVWICSAKSRSYNDTRFLISALHCVMAGTSMATPFVAGTIALMLEVEPELTPEDVKRRFRAICSIPGFPLGTFHERWGFGFPDLPMLISPHV